MSTSSCPIVVGTAGISVLLLLIVLAFGAVCGFGGALGLFLTGGGSDARFAF